MCWWDSQTALCVVLLSEVSRDVVAFCQQPGRNLSLHTSPVLERLRLRNLLQLWESLNLTSVGLNKIGKTPVSFWKSVKSNYHTLLYAFVTRCPSCPVLLDPNSVPPLLSRSRATFKLSSAQLRRWKRRCFRFWTPCLCASVYRFLKVYHTVCVCT